MGKGAPDVTARIRDARSARAAPPLESILEAVGGTPVVRLRRVVPAHGAGVFAKLESFEPGGSVKDRIALAMVEAAERGGRLRPGDSIVEPTSGNTGIGLALVCAVKGYRLSLVMPDSTALEHRQALEDYGARLVLTRAEDGMEAAVTRARELAHADGSLLLDQFANPANPAAHRVGTGPELVAALREASVTPDVFVAGVGTGGTLSGAAPVLRQAFPRVVVVAVEPEACAVLSGRPPGPTRIQGLGAGFVPAVLDRSAFDRIMTVRDEDAWAMKLRLAREEGLLVGASSGAVVVAAARVAAELAPDRTVVTLLADTGERYFSMEAWFEAAKGSP
jgi:cysteine synthase A